MVSAPVWPHAMAARCFSRAVPKVAHDWRSDQRSLPSVEGYGFPRCRRLLKPNEFSRVFKDGHRSADNLFLVLACPNQMSTARLGLAVSKKSCRRAVDRNRVKRVIRESFRHHLDLLQGLDVVVVSRSGVLHSANPRCFDALSLHWQRVTAACAV
jgi:ribonuclease P protein component